MKYIIYVLFFFPVTAIAQITITAGDFNSMFSIGNEITQKANDIGGSVNIGSPGGGNNWDYSSLTGNLTTEIESINPSTAPHISEFPGANIVTYSVGDYKGDLGEVWTYSSLNGSFDNHGAGVILESQPGDLFMIKNEPARLEAALPLTINSTWSRTFTQTMFYNGAPFLTSQVSQSVIVDAYGTMTLPGGESFEALRIRETMTVNGTMTSVSYLFMTKNGAQVSVFAADPNPPTSGVIAAESYSWNSDFTGSGGNAFLHPSSNSIYFSGEFNMIEWVNPGWDSVNIKAILNFTTGFESEYLITQNYSDPLSKFEWDIPDTLLSYKSKIIVENAANPAEFIQSNIFRIKPYIITKLDATESFYIPYDITKDKWSFTNNGNSLWPQSWWGQFDYQNGLDPFTNYPYPRYQLYNFGILLAFALAKSSDYPDWVSLVRTFVYCYYRTDIPPIYNPKALTFWRAKRTKWGGSCFGMATSSALAFQKKEEFLNKYQEFPNFVNLVDLHAGPNVLPVIHELQTHQYGNPHYKYKQEKKKTKTPTQTINDLKLMLSEDDVNIRILSFNSNNPQKPGGHAILAYGLSIDSASSGIYYVNVYDNSYSGNNAQIRVDTYANNMKGTWEPLYAWQGWGGTKNFYLNNHAELYLTTIPKFTTWWDYLAQRGTEDTLNWIYQNDIPSMKITNSQGQSTGYYNGFLIEEIPGADAIIDINGSVGPPDGYELPLGNYSIETNNFTNDTVAVYFFDGQKSFIVSRFEADSLQTDNYYFDGGVSFKNPDPQIKSLIIENHIGEEEQDKIFVLSSISVLKNDSVKVENSDHDKLKLISYGSDQQYELQLNFVSENELGLFGYSDISLPANSSHTFVPDWPDITNSELMVLIDIGNNGTIDDTLFLKNQLTGIKDEGSLLLPDSYNLAQNFPNPFNPITTIKYSIPVTGNVLLKVYDVLGNEVAALVNEKKARGIYSVTFDASKLSSGVYFYKIQAENYIETKKMLLVK